MAIGVLHVVSIKNSFPSHILIQSIFSDFEHGEYEFAEVQAV